MDSFHYNSIHSRPLRELSPSPVTIYRVIQVIRRAYLDRPGVPRRFHGGHLARGHLDRGSLRPCRRGVDIALVAAVTPRGRRLTPRARVPDQLPLSPPEEPRGDQDQDAAYGDHHAYHDGVGGAAR